MTTQTSMHTFASHILYKLKPGFTNVMPCFIRMPSRFNFSLFLYFFYALILIFVSFPVQAEGTKEIMKYAIHNSRIILDPEFGKFAMFGSEADHRLHIKIKEAGEKIYYGFGESIMTTIAGQYVSNDVIYRIVDPNGTVVVNAANQPVNDPGYIATYREAISGPNNFNSAGYTPLEYICNTPGDYYIEFNFPDAYPDGRREFKYFDITVANTNNDVVPGRVWSKAWMYTVSEKGDDPWENPFHGKLFILSDDSIVTSVDFNGMKPFVFTMFANGTGVKNSGNPVEDRKSVPYKLTYPQYKVFLNDPDPLCYPSGSFGEFSEPTTITGNQPPYCINVTTTKPGTVQVLIELNGIKGYQVNSRDILIAQNVGAGLSCISWNGKDGLGELVDKCGGTIKFYATYAGGLTHMPIYDVETNSNGFIIDLVRPVTSSSHLALYWDDSKIAGGTTPPSGGCDGLSGCHKFPKFYGDTSTINTWWYATSDEIDSTKLFNSVVSINGLEVQDQTCSYKNDGSIELNGGGGEPPYFYALNSGGYQDSPLFENLTANSYTIKVKDKNNCTATKEVSLILQTFIIADFEAYVSGAYNELDFEFSGEGANEYDWDFGDGNFSTKENPYHEYMNDTIYYITLVIESGPPNYCIDSITKVFEIYPSLQIFAPNAFTPNGDNLNDKFDLYAIGLHDYEIYVFSSNGTQLFYSNNIDDSWDGTAGFGKCDKGVYAYVIRAKDRNGELHEKKGTVTLLK